MYEVSIESINLPFAQPSPFIVTFFINVFFKSSILPQTSMQIVLYIYTSHVHNLERLERAEQKNIPRRSWNS